MRTVAHILNKQLPLYNVVDPRISAQEAFNLMSCLNCDYIIVGGVSEYLGLITDGDYLRKFLLVPQRGQRQLLAQDIMNCNIPIVDAHDTIKRCLKLMDQFGTHHLPAFNENEFIGVITMGQIVKDVLLHQNLLNDA